MFWKTYIDPCIDVSFSRKVRLLDTINGELATLYSKMEQDIVVLHNGIIYETSTICHDYAPIIRPI